MYDFDVIIVFDAMRYDIGANVINKSNLIGDLTKFNTDTSTTAEWYKKYWNKPTDRNLISENPVPFHKLSDFAARNFQSSVKSFGKTWLEIDPSATLKLYEDSPVLIHFLPPHLPYIFGEGEGVNLCKNAKANIYQVIQNWGHQNGFGKLQAYYREQIENMVALIYDNIHLFDGRTVLLTSDHGEIIDGGYDHPPNRKDPELTEVPYFAIDVEATLIERRLRALGY